MAESERALAVAPAHVALHRQGHGIVRQHRVGGAVPFFQRHRASFLSDLLDVIAVVDAIVTEGVAKAPEFLDYVRHFLNDTCLRKVLA